MILNLNFLSFLPEYRINLPVYLINQTSVIVQIYSKSSQREFLLDGFHVINDHIADDRLFEITEI